MAPPEAAEPRSGYGAEMKVVGVAILVMGISLAIVILLYISFGHIGPTFSFKKMNDQQTLLRQQYGLAPIPPVPDSQLLIPPSERHLSGGSSGSTGSSTNASSTGGNSTGNSTR